MSKKKGIPPSNGIVFSTDPGFQWEEGVKVQETLPSALQKLVVKLDKKHRAGKAVTLVEGFTGTAEDLESLGKLLKNHCGTGGSAKDGQIIVQGDQRDKVLQWLLQKGYTKCKKM